MNTFMIRVFSLIICLGWSLVSYAQDCVPQSGGSSELEGGKVIISYGASTNAVTPRVTSSILLGQAAIGQNNTTNFVSEYGFYTQFLLPPLPPTVTASQGELLDRIQVSWAVDPLGSSPNEGFNIFRDGVFIDHVGPKIRNYNDFNVIAGRPYTYAVSGVNKFGEGPKGEGLGFQVPNGVVTGWIRTTNSRPVPDAQVTLLPMQGFSAKFGVDDGAFAIKNTAHPFLPATGQDWTMTFWINTSAAGPEADVIHFSGSALSISATTGPNGIRIQRGSNSLNSNFSNNEWHHVTLTYDGGAHLGRLYIDGVLEDQSTMAELTSPDSLYFGQVIDANSWQGKIDEFRIYHTLLDELDLGMVKEGTASSTTPFLTHYWKFDEELGEKSFDIVHRHQLFFCGAQFDADRPPVRTAGISNEDGFYLIEGVSYGTGTTFKAEAEKKFYLRRSLEFTQSEEDFVQLPNFAIPQKSTIEMWVNNTNAGLPQTILSKNQGSNTFKIYTELNGVNNQLKIDINGTSQTFGNLTMGFNHLAFTVDSVSGVITGYVNGGSGIARTFTIPGNWSDLTTNWVVGANSNGNSDFFNGLIDELAVYNKVLSSTTILNHAQNPRDLTEDGLVVYFPMDEGNGIRVNNVGSVLLDFGTLQGAEWSNFAANQETSPHEFSPKTRQVTLNPSVTSVDQVDFTDLSTIPISGYVRFKGTDCFQPNVEILVNGASFSPKVFTDAEGKFIIDFDPGFTGILTPVYEDHTFSPASWEVINVTSPVAGILFNNTVKRKISGKVAGGLCALPILQNLGTQQATVCKVKVSTSDGCLERIIQVDNVEGEYEFDDLPPSENLNIAVTEHSDSDIKTYFEVDGGSAADLSTKDTIIDFIYFAPPEIIVESGLENTAPCDFPIFEKESSQTISIKMVERYLDEICPLDTATFRIINGLNDTTLDTIMSGETLNYAFMVGDPNPSPPYLKTLQVIGNSISGRTASFTKQAVVTGIRNKLSTFTTSLPTRPSMILRDPPGDGSYSFIEKGQKICKTLEFKKENAGGIAVDHEIKLGQTTTIAVGAGVLTINSAGAILDENLGYTFTRTVVDQNAVQTCIAFDERISTSESDLIVGPQADLFIGEGSNVIVGFADEVSVDPMSCIASSNIITLVGPGEFSTSFIYSRFQIQNYLIPFLQRAFEAETDSVRKNNFLLSIEDWNQNLLLNDSLVDKSRIEQNVSFDALARKEFSTTIDSAYTSLSSIINDNALYGSIRFGVLFNELGVSAQITGFGNFTRDSTIVNDGNHSISTGYVLADDDPGDAFSVDIATDPMFHTPVFLTRAGQSSCPWETETANRESPNLQVADGSQFVAVNVPANEPAVFKLNLGNLSATNEDWTYSFSAIAANNPHGAIIKLNGAPLNYSQKYIIPYGTSQLVTLTVEKGPLEYDYDNLRIALFSECQYERNLALSLPLTNDDKFFSYIDIGAHFIRPCSEVKINVPQQDWVVFPDPLTPESDDEMRITVSGYDTTEVNFQLVRLQYRKIGGDGAWINIQSTTPGGHEAYNSNWVDFASLPNPKPAELQPNFTQFYWNTLGLVDGEYEIRAVAVCTGNASDKPGFSQYIKGRIDRQPPSLVGLPQPSDGVYHVGDEISFTFNQDINCNKLIQADLIQANNVGLYDATTGNLIDATISCVGNKIVIVPNFVNKFFENKILRAELHNIADLTGNKNVYEQWEFYVDRNELAWLTDSIEVVKFVDETKTISAKIHNRGGYPVPYVIDSIPNWLHVFPDRGTLVANEIEEIFFTVKNDMDLGDAIEDIVLITQTGLNPFFMGGTEPLNIKARNLCRPETWVLNPAGFNIADFDHSMNFVVQLDIEGSMSVDENDIVGAYVDGQLRGIAKIEYQPSINKYLAFLTVYSNQSTGETIKFQIWDASDCKLYAYALESFPFVVNTIQGTVDQTIVLHTNTTLLRKIFLNPGWNWISLNLDMQPNNSVNSVLSSLSSPQGATIKSRIPFSQYSSLTGMWGGNLTTLDSYSMYQYQSVVSDSLSLIGNYIDPLVTPIPLINGWNWISYLPTQSLKVDDALSSLTATTGDIIKSQLHFAQYRAGIGWIGNLKSMNAPNGYLLKLASTNPGFLIYPDPLQLRSDDQYSERTPVVPQYHGLTELQSTPESQLPFSHWKVDPSKYEHNMNIIAIVQEKSDTENILNSGDEVAAFVNGEVRGSSKAIYIEALKSYMIFMTVYANCDGEQLNLKYLDTSENKEYDLVEKFIYKNNHIQGNIDAPQPLHILSTSSVIPVGMDAAVEIYPNPFSGSLQIQYSMMKAQDVHMIIKDIHGKVVSTQVIKSGQGEQRISWVPEAGLVGGAYFITLETESDAYTEKVIYIR